MTQKIKYMERNASSINDEVFLQIKREAKGILRQEDVFDCEVKKERRK